MYNVCQSCGSANTELFYSVHGVPTNSCMLIPDRHDALMFPKADIRLMVCHGCGHMFNAAWQPQRTVYSKTYEETQAYSSTFNAFNLSLARELIERHQLRRKNILEIGCGKGEFITLFCELGDNYGVAYDPSFIPERRQEDAARRVTFVREFFTEHTRVNSPPDLICCKMTLEHIFETARFVGAVRRLAVMRRDAVVFFQIPDAMRILREAAFWDVYYEHCSYFSAPALSRLLRSAGLVPLRLWTGYGDQYLMVEARAAGPSEDLVSAPAEADEIDRIVGLARAFASDSTRCREEWRSRMRNWQACGRRTVLWGSGSKAVSFLTTLGLREEVEYVVDINPNRQGKYMPGSGQLIVSPDFLVTYRPDVVVIMNPIYVREVGQQLAGIGLHPELCALGALEREVA